VNARHAFLLSLLMGTGACAPEQDHRGFILGESSGVTVVTEATEEPDVLWNATAGRGAFFVQNGCLQVRDGASVWTPVLPVGASVSEDRQVLMVAGRPFQMERTYNLSFPAELPADVAARTGLPEKCTPRLLRMRAPD
jgi:hypothetical protein